MTYFAVGGRSADADPDLSQDPVPNRVSDPDGFYPDQDPAFEKQGQTVHNGANVQNTDIQPTNAMRDKKQK